MNKSQLIEENNKLKKLLAEFKGLTNDDLLKLEILKYVPFTMWACDSDFKIVLWTCNSEKLYEYTIEEVIGKNFIELFVDELERPQAIDDTGDIIQNNAKYNNICASDHSKSKNTLELITNCFRVYDKINERFLQAEVALDISDLEEKKRRLNAIRIMGAKIAALKELDKDHLEQSKALIRDRLRIIIDQKVRACQECRKRELDYENEILKKKGWRKNSEHKQQITFINEKYDHLLIIIENRKLGLEKNILHAKKSQLEELQSALTSLNALDVSEMYNKEGVK